MAARKGTGTEKETKKRTKSRKSVKGKAASKKLSPRQRVRKTQEKVLDAMPEIVQNICVEAKRGSHTAAKFVFDFARISELQEPLEEAPSQDSLATLLLDKLAGGEPQESVEEGEAPSTVE